MGKRDKLARIFKDTRLKYMKDPILSASVLSSMDHTVLIAGDPDMDIGNPQKSGHVSVTKERTFECASRMHGLYPDSRITVHNFASSTHPGGGVVSGAGAQEECLCRCSTLYPSLTQQKIYEGYYLYNRDHYTPLGSDACIYTPDVVVFKSDTEFPELLPEEEWFKTDVITCAAPNLDNLSAVDDGTLYDIHLKRAGQLMKIAAFYETDILVLGAFGCGAFRNDPAVTSAAWRDALKQYRYHFNEIIFAVFCREYETKNFDIYREIMEEAFGSGI